ncbi:MAG: 30S ribosomal protein S3 [bacterium]
MGQKVHPYGFRVGITKDWRSRWFDLKNYPALIKEDKLIRDYIRKRIETTGQVSGISRIIIERKPKKIKIVVHSSRPGVIIGEKGSKVDALKEEIKYITKKEDININIVEVRNPAVEAQLVAENITSQIEKRINYKRAMKRAIQNAMKIGAKGIKIMCSGRLNGAEIARTEWYKEGQIPLQTLKADIDYGYEIARTSAGAIGVKVWVFKGNMEQSGIEREDNSSSKKRRRR